MTAFQRSEISVCIEPMQRGTFSAVVLVCAFLHEGGVSPEKAVLAESENTHVINELKTPLIVGCGKQLSCHYHLDRTESWTVTAGEGTVVLDGKVQKVKAGDAVLIRPGMKHLIRADTPLHVIEVQTGKLLSEEDMIRVNSSLEGVDG